MISPFWMAKFLSLLDSEGRFSKQTGSLFAFETSLLNSLTRNSLVQSFRRQEPKPPICCMQELLKRKLSSLDIEIQHPAPIAMVLHPICAEDAVYARQKYRIHEGHYNMIFELQRVSESFRFANVHPHLGRSFSENLKLISSFLITTELDEDSVRILQGKIEISEFCLITKIFFIRNSFFFQLFGKLAERFKFKANCRNASWIINCIKACEDCHRSNLFLEKKSKEIKSYGFRLLWSVSIGGR